VLSTMRWPSGGSGERRLGVGAIPAKGGRGWTGSGRRASGGGGEALGRGDLDGVEGSRRIPREESAAAARCWWSRGRRKGEQQKGGAWFGFIAAHCFVEERERRGGCNTLM
jgi:hypothetical protein